MDNDSLKPRAGNTFRLIFHPAPQRPQKLPGQAFTVHHGGTPPVRARAADLDDRLMARQREEYMLRMTHVAIAALIIVTPIFPLWGLGLISSRMLGSIIAVLVLATAFAAHRLHRAVRSHHQGSSEDLTQNATL